MAILGAPADCVIASCSLSFLGSLFIFVSVALFGDKLVDGNSLATKFVVLVAAADVPFVISNVAYELAPCSAVTDYCRAYNLGFVAIQLFTFSLAASFTACFVNVLSAVSIGRQTTKSSKGMYLFAFAVPIFVCLAILITYAVIFRADATPVFQALRLWLQFTTNTDPATQEALIIIYVVQLVGFLLLECYSFAVLLKILMHISQVKKTAFGLSDGTRKLANLVQFRVCLYIATPIICSSGYVVVTFYLLADKPVPEALVAVAGFLFCAQSMFNAINFSSNLRLRKCYWAVFCKWFPSLESDAERNSSLSSDWMDPRCASVSGVPLLMDDY